MTKIHTHTQTHKCCMHKLSPQCRKKMTLPVIQFFFFVEQLTKKKNPFGVCIVLLQPKRVSHINEIETKRSTVSRSHRERRDREQGRCLNVQKSINTYKKNLGEQI